MSLSAFDSFMNPIVAGRASYCLETLVPILGGSVETSIKPRAVRRPCPAMMLPEAIQRCNYFVASREAHPHKRKARLKPNRTASAPDQTSGNPAFAEDESLWFQLLGTRWDPWPSTPELVEHLASPVFSALSHSSNRFGQRLNLTANSQRRSSLEYALSPGKACPKKEIGADKVLEDCHSYHPQPHCGYDHLSDAALAVPTMDSYILHPPAQQTVNRSAQNVTMFTAFHRHHHD